MARGVTLRLLLLVAALACPAFAPLSMDLKVDGVEADAAPMEGQQPVAAEPTGRSLGGRIRTMAEDLIPTAIIDKVAEMRKPKDTDGEQTQVQDDGGTPPSPPSRPRRHGLTGCAERRGLRPPDREAGRGRDEPALPLRVRPQEVLRLQAAAG